MKICMGKRDGDNLEKKSNYFYFLSGIFFFKYRSIYLSGVCSMIYKHWMHKQQDPWVLFLRCYQHFTGEVSLPPRKNTSEGSIVQSYAKFWQRTLFSLHHAMKLAGLKHSREVSQEAGCESEQAWPGWWEGEGVKHETFGLKCLPTACVSEAWSPEWHY